MYFLTADDKAVSTQSLTKVSEMGVLRVKTKDEPDYYFDPLTQLDEFTSPGAVIRINNSRIAIPLNWTVLFANMEYAQTIPLTDITAFEGSGVLVTNPISGYMPEIKTLRVVDIIPNANWTTPQINAGDMLVMPIEQHGASEKKGPKCIMVSPNKLDINIPLAEIL